ncbi:hypothetical protein BTM25_04460 [Actinomadura rubteroloni]|uniref:LppX_LprAFG lipoprotein n=1 Tax=Actinomadura rubteroloni TaxID=1926885 RepID=A0A2P4ULY5_9ACTN|nr:hypothetical protein [Actinomadura rubteroloni]POM26061.1 hypothetical protein BTM25_04460 [Actinomadura rubteroloni]
MRIPVAVACAAVLTLATACESGTTATPTRSAASPATNGLDKLPAATVLARALAATRGAGSLHVHGTTRDGHDTIRLDLRFADERTSSGSITIGRQRIDVRRFGSTLYLSGNDAFYVSAAGKDGPELLRGKFIKARATAKDFKEMAEMTSLPALVDTLLKPTGAVRHVGGMKVAGRRAIAIADETNSILYVALEGPAYALRLGSSADGTLNFDGFGKPIRIVRPAAKNVVSGD